MREACYVLLFLLCVQANGADAAKPAYDNLPLPIKRVAPYYPDRARTLQFEGTVVIECTIGKDGIPTGVNIAKSSGNDFLDYSAAFALSQWTCTPARKNQKLVTAPIRQEFTFVATPESKEKATSANRAPAPPPGELVVEMALDKRLHAEVLLALNNDQQVIWMKLSKSSGRIDADYLALKSLLANVRYPAQSGANSKAASLDWIPESVRPNVARVIVQPFDFRPQR